MAHAQISMFAWYTIITQAVDYPSLSVAEIKMQNQTQKARATGWGERERTTGWGERDRTTGCGERGAGEKRYSREKRGTGEYREVLVMREGYW